MKFTIDVVPVTESVINVPVSDPILSVPVSQNIDFTPQQDTIVYRQPIKAPEHGDAVAYWA